MSEELTTSAVYSVWRALERLCKETTWPAATGNPKGPTVYFGDPDAAPASVASTRERIIIASAILPPTETWGPIGRYARTEEFTVFVYAFTAIPGRTELQAAERLEELTTVLEGIVRTFYASRPTDDKPAELDRFGSTTVIEVSALAPVIVTTPEGAVGKAEIGIRCKFRIGIPPAT